MLEKEDKILKILDMIGFLLALFTLCLLMLVLVQVDIYFLFIFGILFCYTMFQMVAFLESLISYPKNKHIIKYAFREIKKFS